MIFNRILFSISYRINKLNRFLIKGSNNTVDKKKLIGCVLEIYGNDNRIMIARNAKIMNTRIFIKGNHCRVILHESAFIKGGEIWLEDNNTEIHLGEKTTIESAHIAACENNSKISIGKECMFAHNVEIRTSDSHSILDENGVRINKAADVSIGNNVWLGSRTMVLKGVKIADNTIIGAGSIVTKNIETSNSLSVGSPAYVVKEKITWKRERIN